jgi:glycine/D-amino acid oxidase-like deaminating enzyme
MPRLRTGRSLWLATDSHLDEQRFPTLRGDIEVDLAIVGGGITGVAIAWRFADAGLRVAVLEAREIGRGSTSASTALLMQEPDEDLSTLARRYGWRRARRTWELGSAATRDLIGTIRRLGIDCDLTRSDSIYYAQTAAQSKRLRAEYGRRRAAGIRGQWLDRDAIARAAGMDASGAIRTRGNAQVNPYRACIGFADAAANRGALMFEHSAVTRIDLMRDRVRIGTRRGAVRADRVVIATGYATPYFTPLRARFRMLNTYVIATRPLTPSERRRLGLGDVMLWDTERPYHYARWTRDRRLLLGGGDRAVVREAARGRALRTEAAAVRRYFVDRYPALAAIDIEYAWDGLFAMPPDGLPFIGPHRRYPRHLFALGYGGNGMTLGFLAGRLLLDYHRGRPSDDLKLFAFTRK